MRQYRAEPGFCLVCPQENDVLHVDDFLTIPENELHWAFTRSSGPGGQNVNKVASRALLRWNLILSPSLPPDIKQRFQIAFPAHVTTDGEVLITSQRYRDQVRNRKDCREKLIRMLRRVLIVAAPRIRTGPSRGSKVRRLEDKRHQSKRRSERKIENE